MTRTLVLFALILAGIVVLVGCWPVVQSQPPAAIAPAATATTPPRSAASEKLNGNGAAAKPAAPTAAAKPTSAPTAAPVAAAKPTAKPSPAASGAASASPVAVVATAVAKPPVVGASGGPSGGPSGGAAPVVSTDARGTGPADARSTGPTDAIGVASAAGAVADANTADREAVALCGPGAVLATRAGQQAGRQATVAIPRVAASYQQSVRGQPTFLNDAPYPNHVFTAVIWGNVRRQFQPPPESWQGQSLCVTGSVELYQQRPQIIVSSPSQLRAAR